jgi:hypothetical protein
LDEDWRQMLREEPILDVISLLREQGEKFLRLRAPVRFDYDPNSATLVHPAAHLTFNHHECRMPVKGPLSLGHFVDFIFRNFYPEQWQAHALLREQPKDDWGLTLTPKQECTPHVTWRTKTGFSVVV